MSEARAFKYIISQLQSEEKLALEDQKVKEKKVEIKPLFTFKKKSGWDSKTFLNLPIQISQESKLLLKKGFEYCKQSKNERRFAVIDAITAGCSLLLMSQNPIRCSKKNLQERLHYSAGYILYGGKIYYFDGRIDSNNDSLIYLGKNEQFKKIFPKENSRGTASKAALDTITTLTGHVFPPIISDLKRNLDTQKNKSAQFIHYIVFQPSLPPDATKEDMEELEIIFGKWKVVQAEKKIIGIVHQKTIRLEIERIDFLIKTLNSLEQFTNGFIEKANSLYEKYEIFLKRKQALYDDIDVLEEKIENLSEGEEKNNIEREVSKKYAEQKLILSEIKKIKNFLGIGDEVMSSHREQKVVKEEIEKKRDASLSAIEIEKNNIKKEIASSQTSFSENLLGFGLSLHMKVEEEKKVCFLTWIARSTMQYDFFDMDELATSSFFFNRFKIKTGLGLIKTEKNPLDFNEAELKSIQIIAKEKPAYLLFEDGLYFLENMTIKLIDDEVDEKVASMFPQKTQTCSDASPEELKLIRSYIDHDFEEDLCFYREGHTTEYLLGRSIPLIEMYILTEKIIESIKDILPEGYTIISQIFNDDYCIEYTDTWNIIQKEKQIAQYLENTIFVAAGLEKKDAPQDWTILSDFKVALNAFQDADRAGIVLDINKTPPKFQQYNIKPLTFAVKMEKYDLVRLFVERGACIIDNPDGVCISSNIFYYARKCHNKNETLESHKILIYLKSCYNILTALKSFRIEEIVEALKSNTQLEKTLCVDINKPIHNFLTPLAFLIQYQDQNLNIENSNFLKNGINLLLEFDANIDALSEQKRTPLTYVKSIEIQQYLLEKGASSELALEYYSEKNDSESKELSRQIHLLISEDKCDIAFKNCFLAAREVSQLATFLEDEKKVEPLFVFCNLINETWKNWNELDRKAQLKFLSNEVLELKIKVHSIKLSISPSDGLFTDPKINWLNQISSKIDDVILHLKPYKYDELSF